MLTEIEGLHHVTAMAADARRNNIFFTRVLGLRRVKKTVNFDAPDVYHLYYGDAAGSPGTIMTYFPFPDIGVGRPGVGEVSTTAFSVPPGALDFWERRLAGEGTASVRERRFGEERLTFSGPDGDSLALVETAHDGRAPWTTAGIGTAEAIRGFHSVAMRLGDTAQTEELLAFMGYRRRETEGDRSRLAVPASNGAGIVELERAPGAPRALPGAGSVHHVAFAVRDRAAQIAVRKALAEAGVGTTPVIDRDYFWAIYFRTPGGVLFEIATDEPGFASDEDPAHLGEALKLPTQHAHLRSRLEKQLQPLED